MGVPFSQMPDDLVTDPDMTLSALRAWHVIFVETLGRPGWDMSYSQIAERIGSKRRATAVEAIDLLMRKGWLVRVRQKSAQGDDAPNLFSVCREPFVPWNERQTVPGGTPDRTGGGTPDRTHRENHLPGETPSASALPPLPVMEGDAHSFALQLAPAPAESATDPFDEFWAAYPKKVDKGAARRMWKSALKKAPPGTIIAGAERYAAERRGQEPRYTKNPASWLNAEAWSNEPQARETRGKPGFLIPADNYR